MNVAIEFFTFFMSKNLNITYKSIANIIFLFFLNYACLTMLCLACSRDLLTFSCIILGIHCTRMIHMAPWEHCQIPQESCMKIRLFRHFKRCCSLLWNGMLVSCLTLKHWTVECAKAIHLRISMDRLLLIQYSSWTFPMTRSPLWFCFYVLLLNTVLANF